MARKHLDDVRRAVRRIDAAYLHRDDAILKAKESGETADDIGAAAGIKRTKVYELIRKTKARRGP